MGKFIKEKKQVLVLIDEIEHGKELQEMFKAYNLDVPFTHGSSQANFREECLNDFKSGKLTKMIGSSIYDEGVSVDGIDCIVFGGSKKSAIKYMQRVGRGLRRKKGKENKVIIVDFLDKGNKYLEKWSAERLDIYQAAHNDFDVEIIKENY